MSLSIRPQYTSSVRGGENDSDIDDMSGANGDSEVELF